MTCKKRFNTLLNLVLLIMFLLAATGCQKMDFKKIVKINPGEILFISHDHAVVSGEITDIGDNGLEEYGHCWSVQSNPVISDDRSYLGERAETGMFESVLNELSNGTTYYVRAYATSKDGTVYGEEQTLTSYVIDIDENIYKTVRIGDQVWMAENLKTTKYANGYMLIDGTGVGDIEGNHSTKYYFTYDDNPDIAALYGRLYTATAAKNGTISSSDNPSNLQGVCPTDWHLPSDKEWMELEGYLGMTYAEMISLHLRGTDEGDKLKSKQTFRQPNDNNNESGFSALAGGYRLSDGFSSLGEEGRFWTSTESGSWATYARMLFWQNHGIDRWTWVNEFGLSVRCVRD